MQELISFAPVIEVAWKEETWMMPSWERNWLLLTNIMLLLTNCEVHRGKHSDRSLNVRTEGRKRREEQLRSEYFPIWTDQLMVNDSFIVEP